jgi:hypothetical protein
VRLFAWWIIIFQGSMIYMNDDETNINNRIESFKDILKGHEREEIIVQKYIVHGTPYIFKDDEDKYFDLKREIASNFSEHYSNIYMVGSAKLGFSIAPQKCWQHFTTESDIDMVIISNKLFESFWGSNLKRDTYLL